jgi:hypothetical protein
VTISIQRTNANTIAQRLQTLSQLYRHGQTSEVMDRALDKLFAYEVDTSRSQLRQLENDLAEFEHHYRMTSSDFYSQYANGQTDDRMDFVEWASLVQMTDNLRQRIRMLGDTDQP